MSDDVTADDGPADRSTPVVRRATTADVAGLAGVSLKTVSRVFTGSAGVSAGTRRKVQEAARELGFRPNYIARELRSGGISTDVGFVIGDLGNPFYSKVAAGVERVLSDRGLTMILAATEDEAGEEPRVVRAMLDRGVLALLLVPIADDHSYLRTDNVAGVPVVSVDRPLSHLAGDAVVLRNADGAARAVRLLLDSGHRRIAFVGSSAGLYSHGERLSGCRLALEERGLVPDPALERTDAPTVETAEAACEELLRMADPPSAIFAANNRAAVGVYTALRRRGSDTALVGFDDFDLADALGITVVSYDPVRMGVSAAQRALARLAEGREPEPVRTVEISTSLTVRRSHLSLP
ncbi:LacI family DNA-binding transcriptional regulator [Kocuria sp. M1R5S2]|uniref:LacI family DNA-binding transcriptional regulator n=1 Tax=Kocuria rhizosphaerae TaxID=3376285 RepID=UPI0037882D5F